MKNYLLKNFELFTKKIPTLLLILMVGTGMAFSQGVKLTVSSDADDGAGSLRQTILDAAEGDTIVFSGIDTILVDKPLMIGAKSLTIDGTITGGKIVLDGNFHNDIAIDTNRVLTVVPDIAKIVKLNNLLVTNGNMNTASAVASDPNLNWGGGLFADADSTDSQVIVTNCTFMNNTAVGRGGGAYSNGPNLFENCSFIDNQVTDGGSGRAGGAAVYGSVFEGCTFTGNYSADKGGGLMVHEGAVVNNCVIDGNSSYDSGGGVLVEEYGWITNSTIQNNFTTSSGADGGGIYLNRGYASGLKVLNNLSVDYGGGVYVNNESMIKTSTISGNESSEDRAGGVYIDEEGALVDSCIITENKSNTDGGGVYIEFGKLKNSTVSGNIVEPTSDKDGGGVFIDDPTGLVENCIISNNTSPDHGGGVYMDGGMIINSVITDNTCADDGAGVYMDDDFRSGDDLSVLPKVIGCLIINNTAAESGGGLSTEGGQVINSTITNNYAGADGGGVRGKTNTWKITNSIIYGNEAALLGDNLQWEGNTIIPSIDYCAVDATNSNGLTAENNTNAIDLSASPFVGGMGINKHFLPTGSSLIDGGTTLAAELTTATDIFGNDRVIGAAIDMGAYEALQGSSLVVTDKGNSGANTLRDIVAGASDGDMITFADDIDTIFLELPIDLSDKTLKIDGAIASGMVVLDGRFHKDVALDTNNILTVYGMPGIITELSNLTLSYGHANDASSILDDPTNTGGGLYVYTYEVENAQLSAVNCIFKNNTAEGRGGGVYTNGVNLFENCSFIDNTSVDAADEGRGGGAMGRYSVFEGCTFTGNYAGYKAGGLLNHNGNLANNCVFEDNIAGDDGGGAIMEEYSWITNSTFTNNECVKDDGGAIYINKGYVKGLTLTGNTSGDHGGAIFLNNQSEVLDCIISDNSAGDRGGAIYIDDAGGLVDSCIITGNSSVAHGGGVFNDDGILKNSTITGNSSGSDGSGDGGGVYIDEIVGLVENCIISNNTSGDHGGGAFINAGTLVNCVIDGNECADDGGGVNIDDKSPANPGNLIGCVVTNNSADDQGGGVYVLVGNVINCDIVNNSATGSGNGVRGKGSWKVINSVVYGNDVSNSANSELVFVSHSALDAGHGFTTEIESVIDLTESPFVGGMGEDSLQLANLALVDAGSVDVALAVSDTVKNVLPETTLDGNPRIVGPAIDFGVYETERPAGVAVTGVTLDQATLTIDAGSTGTLVATVAPADATDMSVSWSSDNEAVATVVDGVVTGETGGTATITVTTTDGGFTATCAVTVNPGTANVTGVTLDQATLTIDAGTTGTLVATVAPGNAADKSVTWSSDNEAAATVVDGIVTGVAVGTATITVTTTDGAFTATCAVTVNAATTDVTGVTLDQATLTIDAGTTGTLVATVAPGDATDKSVSWSSDNEAAATVVGGVVTGVAEGTATITVTTTDGAFTATCAVTVNAEVGIDNAVASGFKLYPNPVSDGVLFIELSDNNISSFEIYNALGSLVVKENVNNRTLIELRSPVLQEEGLYFVKMIKQSSTSVERFIVQ